MEKLIAGVGIVAVVAAFWVGIMWLIWSLWCWVLPQVYEGGPHNLIAPGFWLFAACWTLAGMVGRSIFGRGKAAE
jgi:hypothetical protein